MRVPTSVRLVITFTAAVAALAPASASARELPAYPADTARAKPLAAAVAAQPIERLVQAPSLRESTVARIVAPAFARKRLRGPRRGWPVSTETSWTAQPHTLLVLDAKTFRGQEWVKLLLPWRPNGSSGWMPRDRVVLSRTRYWIQVRTDARLVTVFRNGKRVRRFRAVVGKPSTPTPHGLAAIYEATRQPNPGGFIGPWALPLTIMSNVLYNYGGGPGRVAIHGRAGASLLDPLGTAASHGCIRINNEVVSWMAASVPVGTPVRIKR
jgi:lipoprotein-anchoring transpeptidase ErfK/SrfK